MFQEICPRKSTSWMRWNNLLLSVFVRCFRQSAGRVYTGRALGGRISRWILSARLFLPPRHPCPLPVGTLVGLFFDFSSKAALFLEPNIYGFEVVSRDVNLTRFSTVALETLSFILLVTKKRNWLSIRGVIRVRRESNIDASHMRAAIRCTSMLITNTGIS